MKAGDAGAISGDLAVLEWIRDRFAYALDKADLVRVDARLVELRANVNDEDLAAAWATAGALRAIVGP